MIWPRPLAMLPRATSRAPRLLAIGLAAMALLGLAHTASAFAEAPWWRINSEVAPTNLPPGGEGEIIVVVSNLGDVEVNASKDPVVISDALPPGLTATAMTGPLIKEQTPVECSVSILKCTYAGALYPYERLTVTIKVKVAEPQSTVLSLPDEVTVEGGGVPRVSSIQHVSVNSEPTPFGVQAYELGPLNDDGTPATQAGSHPFQLTTTLVMNQTGEREPVALPKDLRFNLPPGLVGNPNAATQCYDGKLQCRVAMKPISAPPARSWASPP